MTSNDPIGTFPNRLPSRSLEFGRTARVGAQQMRGLYGGVAVPQNITPQELREAYSGKPDWKRLTHEKQGKWTDAAHFANWLKNTAYNQGYRDGLAHARSP